ncbi:hypothetical protein OIO90_002139 [Microbotryomycetes sp. JL221]|nr:hypothetical protein OIO90_002139 [Microbotryomycetes sp. JL221]
MTRLSNHPELAAIQDTIAQLVQDFNGWAYEHQSFVAAQLIVGSILFLWFLNIRFTLPPTSTNVSDSITSLKPTKSTTSIAETVSIMQQPNPDLKPPKSDPITKQELTKYDGSNPDLGIYVAIKGTVFDVSAKKDMYGPGCGYNIFTGKDASVALGRSSLKQEDAHSDYSILNQDEMGVLNDWYKYFEKVRI